MQDRYAGDVGDYGKIALLRSIRSKGLTIGVNWYRVTNLNVEIDKTGNYKQADGKYYHIPENLAACDPGLAHQLSQIACSEDRSVNALEKADFIADAVYYNAPVSDSERLEWHNQALDKLSNPDVVFLDPDNGLEVKSVGRRSERSSKYAFYCEVNDYLHRGQSVVVYNHRSRKKEYDYFRDLDEKLQKRTGISEDKLLRIVFPKFSIRDYFALPATEEHFDRILDAFLDIEQSIWGKTGMCRFQYPIWQYIRTEDDERFVDIDCEMPIGDMTFEKFKEGIHRYLMLVWHYSSESAYSMMRISARFIEEAFAEKMSISGAGVEVGYQCG